jgi:hypothetical protein
VVEVVILEAAAVVEDKEMVAVGEAKFPASFSSHRGDADMVMLARLIIKAKYHVNHEYNILILLTCYCAGQTNETKDPILHCHDDRPCRGCGEVSVSGVNYSFYCLIGKLHFSG